MYKVSESEREVLEILWANEPLTAKQVVITIQKTNDWHEKTIKTLLDRLLKKKVVSRRKKDGLYYYSSNISQDVFIGNETSNFVKRLFKGQISPLLANFIENNEVDKNDLESLKLLIKKMKAK